MDCLAINFIDAEASRIYPFCMRHVDEFSCVNPHSFNDHVTNSLGRVCICAAWYSPSHLPV